MLPGFCLFFFFIIFPTSGYPPDLTLTRLDKPPVRALRASASDSPASLLLLLTPLDGMASSFLSIQLQSSLIIAVTNRSTSYSLKPSPAASPSREDLTL